MKPNKPTIEELLYTYRKVKRELYYEKDSISLQRIVDFEEDLMPNMWRIQQALQNQDKTYFLNEDNLGDTNFIFKNIEFNNSSEKLKYKSSAQNIERGLISINKVSFRYMADIAITFQIIGGLWLSRIAYLLDEKFPENLYGCRLEKEDKNLENIPYYKQNHTLYQPYFSHYRKWQNNLFKAIETNKSKDILVITTDIEKYFHSINIDILKIKINTLIIKNDLQLSNEDKFLHDTLFEMIHEFNRIHNGIYKKSFYDKKDLDSSKYGLPLTLIASRFLSNVYLLDFDIEMIKKVKPIYYGRYVDDIIIAVEYEKGLNLGEIIKKLSQYKINDNILTCTSQGKTFTLQFNKNKESQFIFNEEKDKIELNQLKKNINENSSEWKLLPTTENYDNVNDVDIFHNIGEQCEEVSSIRKSNGLILKRNKFVREILNFEENISSSSEIIYKKRLNNFLTITHDYIFEIKNFVDLNKYIPRLFGLLVHAENKNLIEKYFASVQTTLNVIQDSAILMIEFVAAKKFLFKKISEAILCSVRLSESLPNWFLDIYTTYTNFDIVDLDLVVQKYFNSDFHLEPYKNCYFKFEEYQKYLKSNIRSNDEKLLKGIFLPESVIDFISKNLHSTNCNNDCKSCEDGCNEIFESSGFYFYTRRISLLELSVAFKNKILEKETLKDFKRLAESGYYHKFDLELNKGISVSDGELIDDKKYFYIHFNETDSDSNPVVCNTHFLTEGTSYDASVRGLVEPDITRHDRIRHLVNQTIQCSGTQVEKIDYLVIHELSLPRKLYLQIADKLSKANINLIAGIEYKIDRKRQTADSQLVYVLKTGNKSGGSIALYQSKIEGAVHESDEIYKRAGLKIKANFKHKLIIKHNNFVFSGMICNDLLDINNRSPLRGNIDCLFVVAWNTDLETYHHLVKSASLDLHCFVSLCNNKKYGDTRIRAPYKQEWQRDVQRIHGGDIDNFMISKIDIHALRDFQTNLISPSEPFKPFPTGFRLADFRKKK